MATNNMYNGDQLGSTVFHRHGRLVDDVTVPVHSSVTKYRCLSVS